MTNQNEVANTQNQETEIVESHVVRETENYVVKQDANGKFKRKAKYQSFSSVKAETHEDKVWLFNLFEGAEDSGNGLKDHIGKHIEVADIITRPYDSIDEDTGAEEFGVLTYLITPDRVAYVTSSKSVYFTIKNMMDLYGKPSEEGWNNITVVAYKVKAEKGDAIKIKLV
jgi:hypothetical protein